MKYTLVSFLLLAPVIASANTIDSLQDYSGVFESLSLWSTIIIAFVTTAMVWLGGRSMHGGILGKVLDYFSVGMTLMFIGFLINVPAIAARLPLEYSPSVIHNVLYTIAYILMGLGVNKLLRIIKGE